MAVEYRITAVDHWHDDVTVTLGTVSDKFWARKWAGSINENNAAMADLVARGQVRSNNPRYTDAEVETFDSECEACRANYDKHTRIDCVKRAVRGCV